ncbi:MAG: imidazoleglycerol-phosphate dehydratase HisB [Candidatus Bathyarchaeota archaeon]|nr:imidazoleglycerol-phosphate dehydratase HisB [Candidatus Bathyarchaeota archaeon]MCX8176734.1 imidazoleglycerol-phosphate dehydratase HisB [Candidatus Bathyarchaeota archaeon]MDW8193263.1 imidazoleglycerol-phosphate dehydratase HisB [Nitrososphaerota archaeon]
MRTAEVSRKTRETEVYVKVNLESLGVSEVETGIAFLNHLITSLSTHSLMDVTVKVKGDLKHHVAEDVAICLGEAIRKALHEGEGLARFGFAAVPMDCSLVFAAVDLVKRPYAKIDLKLKGKKIEDMPCEDINHFLETLAFSMQANIHIWTQYGNNDHHKAEAAFKALALALKQAVSIDPKKKGIPSSKGVI